MSQWYLIIDVEKCEDCNNCFLACKDEHVDNEWPGYAACQPRHGQRWMNIHRKERGTYPLIDVAYRPTPCMHCQNAPCMEKAQNGAVYRRPDGIVIIDPQKARGRKDLVAACPYGAIFWNEELQLPQKCTLCAHLLDKGWKAPRCVQACPTGALKLVQADDPTIRQMVTDEELEVFHPEIKSRPRVFYKNLYRYNGCFIAGSVAFKHNGVIDCAQGAAVKLLKGGEELAQTVTDGFGDFKFDRLPENSGNYQLDIQHPENGTQKVDVALTTSVSLDMILLD